MAVSNAPVNSHYLIDTISFAQATPSQVRLADFASMGQVLACLRDIAGYAVIVAIKVEAIRIEPAFRDN